MKQRDFVDLILLAALWGASFLFTRIAVPAFGAFALAEVRIAVAALVLLPLLAWRDGVGQLFERAPQFVLLGAVQTAIPFTLFAWAALSITAGMASILNATAPMFVALIAWIWLRDRLSAWQWLGMVLGLAGVSWLAADQAALREGGTLWALAAGLLASVFYGFAANITKRLFTGVPARAVAAGSQTAAALMLAPLAWAFWPAKAPGVLDWAAAAALGVFCTGLAYLLYFRLIARVGASKAMTVTFLIPAFAMLWGALFLDERITGAMLGGCAVILAGTALAVGVVARRS